MAEIKEKGVDHEMGLKVLLGSGTPHIPLTLSLAPMGTPVAQ